MAARRRTIQILGGRYSGAGPGSGRFTISQAVWQHRGFTARMAKGEPDQWDALKHVVEDRDPDSIGDQCVRNLRVW